MAPKPRRILSVALALAGVSAALSGPAAAAARQLERVGSAPRLPALSHLLGSVPSATKLHVTVALEPRDPLALENYATSVSTPGSSAYHRYLTPDEFAARFGAAPAAIAAVRGALRAAGLSPQAVSANGLAIRATAPAALVSRAFHTSLSRVRVGGATAIVNDTAPELSARIAPLVQGIVGLSSLGAPRPLFARPHALSAAAIPHTTKHVATGGPQPCTAASSAAIAQSAYTIDQIASAYDFGNLYKAGDEGAGQTIALYELEPNDPGDIAAYQACFGTDAPVRYIPVDGGSGAGAGSGEAALDIETAIGLAPKASFLVYQAPNSDSSGPGAGPYDLFSEIVSEDKAQVISASWGQCEAAEGATDAAAEQTLFQEAAVQGQTFISASGDQGSEDCFGGDPGGMALAVDDPASQPFVTGVGGTKLQSLGPRPVESAWNDGCVAGLLCGTGASGGGLSTIWPMPTYQSQAASFLNVAQPGCSRPGGQCREVPDVAADGDPSTGYMIYWNGSGTVSGPTKWQSIGGTSAGAPTWAALIALADASAACHGSELGFINPLLYEAASTAYSSDFNDVASGNNDFTGTNGGKFAAGPGYDLATGLGTPNGGPLSQALCGMALQVTNPGAQSSTVGSRVTLQIGVSDTSAPGLTYKATGLPAGLAVNGSTGRITGTPKRVQTTQVEIFVYDAGGAVGRTSFTWAVAGAPRITHASLTGLAAGAPRLSFILRAGREESALRSVTIVAPHGLRFALSGHGVKVFSGGKVVRRTAKVHHRALTIALGRARTSFRATIASPSLAIAGAHVRRRLKVTPTDASGHSTVLTARLTS